jgi:hypothetical protein
MSAAAGKRTDLVWMAGRSIDVLCQTSYGRLVLVGIKGIYLNFFLNLIYLVKCIIGNVMNEVTSFIKITFYTGLPGTLFLMLVFVHKMTEN